MTYATTKAVPPTEAADRPTPTVDRTAREGLIRDLYALAAFYVEHPQHPLPWGITLSHKVPDAGQLQTVADNWTGGKTYGDDTPQCDHVLGATSTWVNLVIRVGSDRDERPL